jgi:hypothetical protein
MTNDKFKLAIRQNLDAIDAWGRSHRLLNQQIRVRGELFRAQNAEHDAGPYPAVTQGGNPRRRGS